MSSVSEQTIDTLISKGSTNDVPAIVRLQKRDWRSHVGFEGVDGGAKWVLGSHQADK